MALAGGIGDDSFPHLWPVGPTLPSVCFGWPRAGAEQSAESVHVSRDNLGATLMIPFSVGRAQPILLVVVGGASGVGKSTLLEPLSNFPRFNTGTFFKNRMSLANRDDVRKQAWPHYEADVSDDLVAEITTATVSSDVAILDTHFAAKTPSGEYRIGLRAELLFSIGARLAQMAEENGRALIVKMVLARCDPHALLHRRRLDSGRARELVPSDCFNALRENDHCSLQYSDAFRRSIQSREEKTHLLRSYTIENDDLDIARSKLVRLLSD